MLHFWPRWYTYKSQDHNNTTLFFFSEGISYQSPCCFSLVFQVLTHHDSKPQNHWQSSFCCCCFVFCSCCFVFNNTLYLSSKTSWTVQYFTLQISPHQVFQCLLIDGENAGADAIRNASTFVISDKEFNEFLERHSSVKSLVPESNEKVSVLIIRNGYPESLKLPWPVFTKHLNVKS